MCAEIGYCTGNHCRIHIAQCFMLNCRKQRHSPLSKESKVFVAHPHSFCAAEQFKNINKSARRSFNTDGTAGAYYSFLLHKAVLIEYDFN